MGTQGEFKEYVNTGSAATWSVPGSVYPFVYKYETVYSLTNPPPVNSLFINDATKHTGVWQTIQVVSASNFSELSGSTGGTPTGVIIPAGTELKGYFTDIKLATGIVLALNEARA